jgi:hypothetical protein
MGRSTASRPKKARLALISLTFLIFALRKIVEKEIDRSNATVPGDDKIGPCDQVRVNYRRVEFAEPSGTRNITRRVLFLDCIMACVPTHSDSVEEIAGIRNSEAVEERLEEKQCQGLLWAYFVGWSSVVWIQR